MGCRLKFRAEGNEAFFGDSKKVLIQIAARNEEKVNPRRKKFLMAAKNFPKATFGAVAVNGITDGFDRSDDADTANVVGSVFPWEPP